MRFIILFLIIGCSQFYAFKSGVPQPSHILLLLTFCIVFLINKNLLIFKRYSSFINSISLFIVYASCVNIIFLVLNLDVSFAYSISYYIFGYISVLTTLFFLSNEYYGVSKFAFALYAGLVILYILSLLGIGRFDFAPRFNAFFNDPNQMAFWSICVSGSIFMLANIRGLSFFVVVSTFILLVFIIISSASRSALVGLVPMLIGLILMNKSYFKSFFGRVISLFVAIIFVSVFLYLVSGLEQSQFFIDRVNDVDAAQQLSDRGYDRFKFYEYLLFGAGQGADYRFGSSHEIHSTWAGVLFYYGAVGFLMLAVVISKIFFKLSTANKYIFLSPLLYSFSTFGARTPIFWVFLGVAIFSINNKKPTTGH